MSTGASPFFWSGISRTQQGSQNRILTKTRESAPSLAHNKAVSTMSRPHQGSREHITTTSRESGTCHDHIKGVGATSRADRLRVGCSGRVTARAEDAQGTPTYITKYTSIQSSILGISPSILAHKDKTRGSARYSPLLSLLLSSLELSDTQVYEPKIRALLGTASHFCEVVVLKLIVWYLHIYVE